MRKKHWSGLPAVDGFWSITTYDKTPEKHLVVTNYLGWILIHANSFFDFIAWSYSVRSPFEIPLGGTQSAICYLAIELAKLGHEVTLFNRITSYLETDGVRCVPIGQATQDSVRQLDVAIVSAQAHQLRNALGGQTLLILRTQHAHDQPAVAPLSKPEYRNDFDGFAMVSNWQMNNYCRCFDIDPARCSVMRNAVSPAFEEQFSESRNILTCKEPHRPSDAPLALHLARMV